jgi:DNA-binding MarR family transcriptional regulator
MDDAEHRRSNAFFDCIKRSVSGLIILQKIYNFSITELMIIGHVLSHSEASQTALLGCSNASVGTAKAALKSLIDRRILRSRIEPSDKRKKNYLLSSDFLKQAGQLLDSE